MLFRATQYWNTSNHTLNERQSTPRGLHIPISSLCLASLSLTTVISLSGHMKVVAISTTQAKIVQRSHGHVDVREAVTAEYEQLHSRESLLLYFSAHFPNKENTIS